MRIIVRLIQLLLISLATGTSAHSTILYKENTSYSWFTQSYRFYHQVDLHLQPLLSKQIGGDYRMTYSLGETAIDLQATYLATTWKSISTPTDINSGIGGAFDDPTAQINLKRNAADAWTQFLFELGYSYRGRLVPMDAKKWLQTARASFGYTSLKDQTHHNTFSGPSFGTEFSLWYQLYPKILIGPTLGYRFGWAYLSGASHTDANRIPLVSLNTSIGTVFKF